MARQLVRQIGRLEDQARARARVNMTAVWRQFGDAELQDLVDWMDAAIAGQEPTAEQRAAAEKFIAAGGLAAAGALDRLGIPSTEEVQTAPNRGAAQRN